MTDRKSFGHDTTTDEVLDGIDLSGKTAFVTGGSGGLGAETARALAAHGASVTITARNIEKGNNVVEEIKKSTGNQNIDLVALELSDFDSVRKCAQTWLASHDKIDMLMLNAGVMACPLTRNPQGYEHQFATNHLGHFLLTGLLVPAILKGSGSRIVATSSARYRASDIHYDDIHFDKREYEKWSAYGQAKTANALFALEINNRLKDKGVRAFSLHPGVIRTDLQRHFTEDDVNMIKKVIDQIKFKTVESGAATQVWAASAPELESEGGIFLQDCQVAGVSTGPESKFGAMPYAADPESAAKLWVVSEEMVGQKFEF